MAHLYLGGKQAWRAQVGRRTSCRSVWYQATLSDPHLTLWKDTGGHKASSPKTEGFPAWRTTRCARSSQRRAGDARCLVCALHASIVLYTLAA